MPETRDRELTLREHKDKFRGRCALALDFNGRIARELANAIRISPMAGVTPATLAALAKTREDVEKMLGWIDQAEQSARAIVEAESVQEARDE